MARKPRLHIPGASYRVILRGNARNDIFFAEKDCYRFYLLLQEGMEYFRCRAVARDATSLIFAACWVAERSRVEDVLHHKIERLRHDFAHAQVPDIRHLLLILEN